MKYKYHVVMQDEIEMYCATRQAVLETIDDMCEQYGCSSGHIEVYEVAKMWTGTKYRRIWGPK